VVPPQDPQQHVTPPGADASVPEANRPGHHPDVEQDKPVEQFAAKARASAAPRASDGVPGQPRVEPDARGTGEEDLAQPSAGNGHAIPRRRAVVAPAVAAWDALRRQAPPQAAWDAVRQAQPRAAWDAVQAQPRAAWDAVRQAQPKAAWDAVQAQPRAAWDAVRRQTPPLVVLPLVAVPPVAVLDALHQPGPAWTEIDESKTGWLARITFIPFIGAWRYATAVRPRLEGAAAALHHGDG
jgi:hypothetical protein